MRQHCWHAGPNWTNTGSPSPSSNLPCCMTSGQWPEAGHQAAPEWPLRSRPKGMPAPLQGLTSAGGGGSRGSS
eukprot:9757852-Lingulodinium_polyedra.AAC.1